MSSNPRTFTRSFTGGEVAPDFYGRVDDIKYQTGLAKCRNFIVKPHGPAANRPGTAFVRETKDSTKKSRLIPFIFASDQSVIVEVGEGYFRFHTFGATLLCPAGGTWVTATPYAVGDLVTVSGATYYCTKAHTSDAAFATDLAAEKWYAQPVTGEYEVPNTLTEEDLPNLRFIQSNDVLTLTSHSIPPSELRRYGATKWLFTPIAFVPALSPPSGVVATATPVTTTPGTPTLQSYVVTAVSGRDESRSSALGSGIGGQGFGSFTITGATKANPIVVTCRTGNALLPSEGAEVFIDGVAGMTQLNGKFFTVHTVTPILEDVPPPPTDTELPRGGTYYDNYWGGAIP